VKLNALLFKTLYHWVAAFDFNISSFNVFFRFFFLLLVKCFSCIHFVYMGCTFVLFHEFAITYEKNDVRIIFRHNS
jgi:hypothetical protein